MGGRNLFANDPAPKGRNLFAEQPEAEPLTALDQAIGAAETVATIGSSIAAEPVAGITGIIAGGLSQIGGLASDITGKEADPAAAAAQAVQGVRDLSFQPSTEAGQQQVQAIGEAVQPVTELLGDAEQALGDVGFDIAGPVGGAIGTAIPTALLMITGAATTKGITKLKQGRELNKAIKDSTPSTEELKNASRTVFKEIDDLGVTVEPNAMAMLTRDIEKAARNVGASPRTTKQVFGVIDDFKEVASTGKPINLSELDELRTIAQNAAKNIDLSQKAPALAIIDEIDSFLEVGGSGILVKPKGSPNIGAEYKAARQLWGRARKSELLEEAFVKAKDTASGTENGLRIEFRKILKNKKQQKFFNADEKAAMREVSEGTKSSNLAKLIGRMGFSEGQAANAINPLIAGGVVGSTLGGPAGLAVVGVGQVSKMLAQKLTKNNSRFANQVVKAGNNAEQITKSYMRNTPKGERSAIQLSELFMRNEVDLSTATSAIAKDAANLAKQRRSALKGATIGGLKPEDER